QGAIAPAGFAAALDKWARPVSRLSSVIVPLGMLGWLTATAGNLGNGWSSAFDVHTLWLVLSATAFGQVWQPLLMLAVALASYDLLFRANWTVLIVLSAALLLGLGLVGHAAILGGLEGVLTRISQEVHLLSSAFWLASLFPL